VLTFSQLFRESCLDLRGAFFRCLSSACSHAEGDVHWKHIYLSHNFLKLNIVIWNHNITWTCQ
jgi:hypothetical protein